MHSKTDQTHQWRVSCIKPTVHILASGSLYWALQRVFGYMGYISLLVSYYNSSEGIFKMFVNLLENNKKTISYYINKFLWKITIFSQTNKKNCGVSFTFLQISLMSSLASLVAQRVKRLQCRRPGFDPWVGKIPWRSKWQPTPLKNPGGLPGKYHGWRSLGATVMGLQTVGHDWTTSLSL